MRIHSMFCHGHIDVAIIVSHNNIAGGHACLWPANAEGGLYHHLMFLGRHITIVIVIAQRSAASWPQCVQCPPPLLEALVDQMA